MNTIIFMLALVWSLLLIDYWISAIVRKKCEDSTAIFFVVIATIGWTEFYYLTH